MVPSPSEVEGVHFPLAQLAFLLYQARATTGLISIPPELYNAVGEHLNTVETLPVYDITTMVEALDSERSSICTRFNDKAFIITFAVLRRSEPCWAQNRGLCLLTHSICTRSSSSSEDQPTTPGRERTLSAARKARIGPRILHWSLSYFCNRHNSDGARRWMGLLALELLKDSPENQSSLELGPEDQRRSLGQLVIDEKNELLRLIAGSIIREMVATDMPEDTFWPTNNNAAAYAGFPKSQYHTSQWIASFELYLDGLHSQMNRTDQSFLRFAIGLRLDDLDYSFDGASVILVTVDDFLSIVIPGDSVMVTKYLDLPLDSISSMQVNESFGSFQTTYDISIDLAIRQSPTVYINAVGYSTPTIILNVNDYATAEDIEARVTSQQSTRKSHFRNLKRESELLDTSQREDRMDIDHENGIAQDLVSFAAFANLRMSEEEAKKLISSHERTQVRVEVSDPGENRESNSQNFSAPSIGVILEVEPSTNEKTYPGSLDWESHVSQKIPEQTNGYNSPLNGMTSSAQWRQQADSVKDAPRREGEHIEHQMQEAGHDDMLPSNPISEISQSLNGHRASQSSPPRHMTTSPRNSAHGVLSNLSNPSPSIEMNNITTSKVNSRVPNHEGAQSQTEISKEVKPPMNKKKVKSNNLKSTVAPKPSKLSTSKPIGKGVARPKSKGGEVQQSEETASAAGEENDDVFDIPDSPTKRSQGKSIPRLKQKTYSRSKKKTAKSKQTITISPPQAKTKGKAQSKSKRPIREKDSVDGSYLDEEHEIEGDEIEDDGPSTGKRKRDNFKALPTSKSKVTRSRTVVTAPAVSPTKAKSRASKHTTDRAKGPVTKRQSGPTALPRSRPQRAAAIQANQKIQSHSMVDSISSQTMDRKSAVQDVAYENDTDLPQELDHDTDIPPQSQQSAGDELNNDGRTRLDVEQEGSFSERENGAEFPVLQLEQDGNVGNQDKNDLPDTVRFGMQAEKIAVLLNSPGDEVGFDECSNMAPDRETNHPALGVDGLTERPRKSNIEKVRQSNGPVIDLRSLHSIIIPVNRREFVVNMDRNSRPERGTPATSNIFENVGIGENTIIQGLTDLQEVSPDEKNSSSVDLLSNPANGLDIEMNAAVSATGNPESINGSSIDRSGKQVHGDERNDFADEQLNQHFDQAKAFTDLDSMDNTEPYTSEEIVSQPLIVNKLIDRESRGIEDDADVPNVPRNKDVATAIDSIKHQKATAKAGSNEKAQKAEKNRVVEDTFAAKVKGALSKFMPKPGPPISSLYRGNRALSGFQLTPATSITHQKQDRSETVSHENVKANSDRSSAYSTEKPQRGNASSYRHQASSVVQRSLPEPQKIPNAPEAVMVSNKDEISRAQVKAESQKSRIIVISSRENTDSGDASEIQELERLFPPAQERTFSNKRKSDDITKRDSKRLKISTPKQTKATTTPVKEDMTPQKDRRGLQELKTKEYLLRKPALISFSAKGPRNQGVLKEQISSRNNFIEHEDTHKAAAKVSPAPKRKKSTSGITRIYGKRRRTETGSYVSPKYQVNPKVVERIKSPARLIPSHYHGSQSTKVDSKGSPIPMSYPSRKVSSGCLDIPHLMANLSDVEDDNLWTQALPDEEDTITEIHGKALSLEMELPALQLIHSSGIDWIEKPSSSIGKLLPSSPTAPSRMLSDMTAHRLQPGGHFINVQTESIVRVADLQDPFLGKPEGPASNFLQLLRASSKNTRGEALKGNVTWKEPNDCRVSTAKVHGHDPDKTLVETELGHDEPSSSSSGESSSSHSSRNGKQLPSSTPSYDASQASISKQWREALRPHQRGTLEALYNVSNQLVRHLIDKETAIDDLVKEYEQGGVRLIEELDKAQQEEHERYETHIGEACKKIVKGYEEVEAELRRELHESKKSRKGDIAKMWKAEQQNVRGHLDAALVACGE